jgi:hypothetical protein
MPEKDFYFIIILSVVIGLLLIRTIMARVARRRDSPGVEQGIVEYLRRKERRQKITGSG